ncbi:lipopolysaccharide transport periplasmic protein LptA [Halomonas denitrificans]|uniref:lipopolysaccharide transport periplasmic protein LptA n=1 Tax=Halomonas TaxID=2745 RepID=UPI001A8E61D5|nr:MULTISPECIES: lipopolysaccharide transport periplasmic protein LptA [Halomonas]MED5296742.1 lipopolysaccharide transport periplasmic protein LptA [Pseudomonadota bacterium]MBN8410776.1 lipopolysaccharide transport periplasmic protein LptA [Halomonas litopenaei]MBY5925638.1 lipopolysaccharide transport periplasmic protein LptA [Halomonas sp. DP4Y7-2]MBY5969324.1 lipopolysaccharide transport periplasmic protein LptA [Halomonas denitrificans]MBY5984951.1 lipopolysaccharide transport periplasmi
MMRPRPALLLALALGLTSVATSTVTLALESDRSAPIQVEADQLDLDDRAGTAVYTGDVRIQQGSMLLTGERVEIQRNDQGQLSRATATGSRAYLEQQPSPEEPVVKGWGKKVVYHVAERRMELIDQAELHKANDTFDGAYLEYFLDRRVVQARSSAQGVDGQQRIRMTLEPESQGN